MADQTPTATETNGFAATVENARVSIAEWADSTGTLVASNPTFAISAGVAAAFAVISAKLPKLSALPFALAATEAYYQYGGTSAYAELLAALQNLSAGAAPMDVLTSAPVLALATVSGTALASYIVVRGTLGLLFGKKKTEEPAPAQG